MNEWTAMQTTAVYSCVRILSEAVASLPVHLYRYAGHMVSGKKAYESFGSRRQVGVDRSDWIVVRDTHEMRIA